MSPIGGLVAALLAVVSMLWFAVCPRDHGSLWLGIVSAVAFTTFTASLWWFLWNVVEGL